ncbi:serine/threonine-protein kinase [Streptomyces hydrogenans]|uniref:serine/threonine-protein kinase n=1 Tax=Streptomyces hydrogenans TaxID=1873719 RepID=UPI00345C7199
MSSTPSPAFPSPRAVPSPGDPHEIGGYRIQARLGAGGMGVVYLARTPGGRPLALKAVREDFAADPEFRRRFAQEVASARRIHGLFTAQVVDAGPEDPVPWLATAYVAGPPLQQVVERHGPLPPRTVLLLIAGIAEALQAIHRAGVIHRDLKPANVLLAEDGPRVIDFGIARAADATGLTGTGLRIGTAAYMAPEQALGHAVTPATDVFALGALAAYAAGGALPFGTGPESGVLYRVVHEPADVSRVPAELRELIGHCLAKAPGGRPGPAALIAAVRAHPAVGPSPEFGADWLPGAVGRELLRRAERPAAAEPTRLDTPSPSPHETPSPHHTPSPHDRPTRTARPESRRNAAPGRAGERGGPRRARTVLTAAAALLAAGLAVTAAVLLLTDGTEPDGPPPGGSASRGPSVSGPAASGPAPDGAGAGAFRPDGYADVELTAPDDGYEFDLDTGKVVPAETASWYLAREGDAFVVPEDADAFVASGYALGPADCVRGLDTEPVTDLSFGELADERPFCLRSPDGRRIAVVRLVEAAPGGGSVTVVASRYGAGG